MEMTGFPYSEEGAITSIAFGPLSSERWEPLLLVLSFTRSERKGRRERTHTKPQPLSGAVEAEGCLEAKVIPLTLWCGLRGERGAPAVSAHHRQILRPRTQSQQCCGTLPLDLSRLLCKGEQIWQQPSPGPTHGAAR